MESSIVLDSLQWNIKWAWDSSCSDIGYLVNYPFYELQGLKGGKKLIIFINLEN